MKQAAALEKTAPRSSSVSTLTAAASKLAAASIAENTWIAYQGALRRLQSSLQNEGRDLAGLDDEQLAEYLTNLHGSGAAPATAAMVVAAVRFLSKSLGQASPVGPLSGRVMAGLRREGRDRGRGQVQGLQWGQADTAAAVASSGGQSLAGLRDAALIAVMSDCLLRVSEAVALQVEDLQLEEDGTGRLTIGRSKTDQEGEGTILYVGAPTVSRIRAWLRAASIESGPIFRRVRRGDKVIGPDSLSTRAARDIIKRRAAAADLEGRFSGHSLRVGSAQSLAAGGASLVEMQTAGRWQSPSMPGHYARGQLAARGAVARLRYGT